MSIRRKNMLENTLERASSILFPAQNTMENAPLLYKHAVDGKWDALIQRCLNHSHEACWSDKSRDTALHIACRRQPPVEVISALLQANPLGPTLKTVEDMTPLHFACFFGANAEVVSLLVDTYHKAGGLPDKRGRTPLHSACAGMRTDDRKNVIQILLKNSSNLSLQRDDKGYTPLSLIFEDYKEDIEEFDVEQNQRSFPNPQMGDIDELTDLKQCVLISSLLLQSVYYGSVDDQLTLDSDKHCTFHAAVGVVECPASFVRVLLRIDPEKVKATDSNNNFPLHIAASAQTRVIEPQFTNHSSTYNQISSTISLHSSKTVIDELLNLYPKAASCANSEGKLPYILAIESGKGWDDGLGSILDACPELFDEDLALPSILNALSGSDARVRAETSNTCGRIIKYCKKGIKRFVIGLINGAFQEKRTEALQRATLNALVAILQNVEKEAHEDDGIIRDVLEVGEKCLFHQKKDIREGAAMTIVAAGELLGLAATIKAIDYVLKSNKLDEIKQEEETCSKIYHGEVCVLYQLMKSKLGCKINEHLFNEITVLANWFLAPGNATFVREVACLLMGELLGKSKNSGKTLEILKGNTMKCMYFTEEKEIHMSVARGLNIAVEQKSDIFKATKAVYILEAALFLAKRGHPETKLEFEKFLWCALKIDVEKIGANDYLQMSDSRYARILMQLSMRSSVRIKRFPDSSAFDMTNFI